MANTLVKFYRGPRASYNATTHKDGVYFATNTAEIILNGTSYGVDKDLASTLQNGITSVTFSSPGTFTFKNANDLVVGSAITIPNATASTAGLMTTTLVNALANLLSDMTTLKGDGDGSISKTVGEAVAQIVAGAPEEFNTLKEIADWITDGDTVEVLNIAGLPEKTKGWIASAVNAILPATADAAVNNLYVSQVTLEKGVISVSRKELPVISVAGDNTHIKTATTNGAVVITGNDIASDATLQAVKNTVDALTNGTSGASGSISTMINTAIENALMWNEVQ